MINLFDPSFTESFDAYILFLNDGDLTIIKDALYVDLTPSEQIIKIATNDRKCVLLPINSIKSITCRNIHKRSESKVEYIEENES